MRRTVAVVGGGCTGAMVAMDLLRCTGADVVLIEPGEPGAGLAYGAAEPWHLLNSRAGAMSADPDDPGHFVRWAAGQGLPAGPDDFLPRRDYGRYLAATFAGVVAGHPGRYDRRPDRAVGVRPDGTGWTVALAGGGTVRAGDVVIATGNPAGAAPVAVPASGRYIGDPWRPGALDAVPGDAPVLLIGTGLTAVDVVLTLTARGTRTAPVVAVSRSGRLPQAHTAAAAPPVAPAVSGGARLRDVLRALRATVGETGDWRPAVDGLRPVLDRLWAGLSRGEQDSFLRHLARTWECHRHRMAPPVADRIADLRARGLLEVYGGGVGPITAAPGGFRAEPAARDGAARTFGAVVNCAGPGRLPGSADPFVAGLLGSGLARVGPHALGLDVDPAGRLTAADGTVADGLWVVGPLRRGALWETTAVPEIRAQARRLAGELAEARPVPLQEAA
ncbi:FAD/NAD(P)-binding protein [Jidongwangia harbinensis]|uniref:FAD/NAD(P)-binding protein n=1 Tax=Jidongwangia harbinensis TaxID=2878561 RepID=UPI001CDA4EC8|nr:FAD/NAD(P)-binding protein [Jidongwangia harbinensis]MCA2217695.1 FAD/NAD(P)-binding protein [Jidongwangia harbinensis]